MDVPNLKRVCGVYAIECVANGKIYIGSSIDIYGRLMAHKRMLIRGSHANVHLQRSWKKYGLDAFSCRVLEYCDKFLKIERENYWIDKTGAFRFGFNRTAYANYLPNMAPEHAAKLSKRLTLMNLNQSEARRKAASDRMTKMNKLPLSEEVRRVRSERAKRLHAEGKLNTAVQRSKSSLHMKRLHANRLSERGAA